MAQKEFTRLSERDFEILFPEKVVSLGKTKIVVKPLDIHDTNYFAACMREEWPHLFAELVERGITEHNIEEKMLDVADILVSRSPMLLAILTSLHPDDASRIPAVSAVLLLDAVFEVNFQDRDFFELVSIIRRVSARMTAAIETGDPAADLVHSPTSPQPSSKKDTRGKRSSRTRGDNSARSTSPPST